MGWALRVIVSSRTLSLQVCGISLDVISNKSQPGVGFGFFFFFASLWDVLGANRAVASQEFPYLSLDGGVGPHAGVCRVGRRRANFSSVGEVGEAVA